MRSKKGNNMQWKTLTFVPPVLVCLLVTLLLTAATQQKANALSCVLPVLNDAAIEQANLIFEGEALSAGVKPPHRPEDMYALQDFTFSVDRVWKGHVESGQVTVWGNTYWGEPFTVGEKYLVVAEIEGRRYVDHDCGNTVHIREAGDKIEILKMKLGNTEDNTGDR